MKNSMVMMLVFLATACAPEAASRSLGVEGEEPSDVAEPPGWADEIPTMYSDCDFAREVRGVDSNGSPSGERDFYGVYPTRLSTVTRVLGCEYSFRVFDGVTDLHESREGCEDITDQTSRFEAGRETWVLCGFQLFDSHGTTTYEHLYDYVVIEFDPDLAQ